MIITKYRSIEITQDNIVNRVLPNLLLSDNVLVFNYEGQWIIIPLSILIKYPILFIKFKNKRVWKYCFMFINFTQYVCL